MDSLSNHQLMAFKITNASENCTETLSNASCSETLLSFQQNAIRVLRFVRASNLERLKEFQLFEFKLNCSLNWKSIKKWIIEWIIVWSNSIFICVLIMFNSVRFWAIRFRAAIRLDHLTSKRGWNAFKVAAPGRVKDRHTLRTRFDQNQKRQSAWCLNRALKMELSAFPLIAIRVLSRSPSNSSYSFPNNELHKEIQNSFAFNFSRRSESPETSAPKKETPHGVPFLHYDQINLK